MTRGHSLRVRLIAAYVAFVAPVVALSGFYYYDTARRGLDRELGKGLCAVAGAAATRFNPLILSSFGPEDRDNRALWSYHSALERIRERAGLDRVFIFDLEFRSLLDTREGVRIGTTYSRLQFQRPEIESALAGSPTASVLFRGEDGQWYKSGFAAIEDDDGNRSAVIAVDASADYLQTVAGLGRSVGLFVVLVIALTVIIAYILARTVSRPVNRLVSAAESIGRGLLDRPVEVEPGASREMGVLAAALNRMRQSLNEREENQRLMVAGVAHEIRNPLGGIEIFAALAREEVPAGEARRYLDRVVEEVSNLKEIINNFLDYARPAPPVRESLDLRELVTGAAELVEHSVSRRGARISLELDGRARRVFADRGQISRALLNLLTNAVEALPESGGGTVRVVSRPGADNEVIVEVADNGCGMDDRTREKVFHPFFTTRDKGIGLGLAIVRKTVEENGGLVTVESEPGRGSVFRLTLPAVD